MYGNLHEEKLRILELCSLDLLEQEVTPLLMQIGVQKGADNCYRIWYEHDTKKYPSLKALAKHCLECQLKVAKERLTGIDGELGIFKLSHWIKSALVPEDRIADLFFFLRPLTKPMSHATAKWQLDRLKNLLAGVVQWNWEDCGKLGFPVECWAENESGITPQDKVRILLNYHHTESNRVIVRSTIACENPILKERNGNTEPSFQSSTELSTQNDPIYLESSERKQPSIQTLPELVTNNDPMLLKLIKMQQPSTVCTNNDAISLGSNNTKAPSIQPIPDFFTNKDHMLLKSSEKKEPSNEVLTSPFLPSSSEFTETSTPLLKSESLSAPLQVQSQVSTHSSRRSKRAGIPLSDGQNLSKKPKIRSSARFSQNFETQVPIIEDSLALKLLRACNHGFENKHQEYNIPYINHPVNGISSLKEMRSILCKNGVPLAPGVDNVRTSLTESESEKLKVWVRLAIAPDLRSFVQPSCAFGIKEAQLALMASSVVTNECGWKLGDLTFSTFSQLSSHIHYHGFGQPIVSSPEMEKAMVCIALGTSTPSSTFVIQEVPVKVEPELSVNLLSEKNPYVKRDLFAKIPSTGLDEIPLPVRICQKRKRLDRPIQKLSFDEIDMMSQVKSSSDSIYYYETLGSLRKPPEVSFKWGKQLGCRRTMGRQYFDSFVLHKQHLTVGDFVVHNANDGTNKLFKIVSAFQAIHSVHGIWTGTSRSRECLQKRGEPYVEVVPFENRKKLGSKNEVFLHVADSWHVGHVQAVPLALIEDGESFSRVRVQIYPSELEESFEFVCVGLPGKVPLLYAQKVFLAETCPQRLQDFVYGEWADACKAEAVQLLRRERVCSYHFKGYVLPIIETKLSSDDSDSDECDEDASLDISLVSVARFDSKELHELQRVQNGLKVVKLRKKTPLPTLSISGSIFNLSQQIKKCKDDSSFDTGAKLLELLQKAPIISSNAQLAENATKLQYDVSMAIRQLQPLRTFFTIYPESELQTSAFEPELKSEIGRILRDDLNFPKRLHCLQSEFIMEALSEPHIDTVLVAPCGFGKSLCFAVPALFRRGVTFVIEPLRVLVENQYNTFEPNARAGKFDVHRLLSRHLAASLREKDHDAVLLELRNRCRSLNSKSTLIFSTPELIDHHLAAISWLKNAGVLVSIVFDEFDIQTETYEDFREVYTNLLPKLRESCPDVSLMFLSATASKRALLSIVPKVASPKRKIKLFVASRAISDNLIFKVERKENPGQVAMRIKEIIGPTEKGKNAPKALCYCLSKKECREMAGRLNVLGIHAIAFTSDNNDDGTAPDILRSFLKPNDNTYSLLCCTTVLGRGFHHPSIRFVFHAYIPHSLSNYIQETGRGGRDGHAATCVLFYRNQDISLVESIKGSLGKKLPHAQRLLLDEDMMSIATYCFSDKCRYAFLTAAARSSDGGSESKCLPKFPCDNCWKRGAGSRFVKADLSPIVSKFLGSVEDDMRQHLTATLTHKHIEYLLRRAIGRQPVQAIVPFLRRLDDCSEGETPLCVGDIEQNSPANDLLRYLRISGVLNYNNGLKEYAKGDNFEVFENQLVSKSVSIFVEYMPVTLPACQVPVHRHISKVEDAVNLQNCVGDDRTALGMLRHQSSSHFVKRNQKSVIQLHGDDSTLDSILFDLPFFLQFEVCRALGLVTDADVHVDKDKLKELINEQVMLGINPVKFLNSVHDLFGSVATMSPYLSRDGKTIRESLYFQANLRPDGVIKLICPEVGIDRRIFRKFGSNRFLHINVCSDNIPNWFQKGFNIFGRYWRFLWCKTTKSPQCYIFFAEKGVGISQDKAITVEKVRNWCIPIELNKGLTIAKEFKRLKLSFSKTTPSGILPHRCVEIIDDIVNLKGSKTDSSIMTDGCGLISRDGIDYIWRAFHGIINESDAQSKEIEYHCPCASFQGRIGGFKGMWVYDSILGSMDQGIILHCRRSQLKYNLPMRCLTNKAWEQLGLKLDESIVDDCYDTVDVNSWDDTPEKGRLSIRAIQLLEERGACYDIVEQCAKDGTKELEEFTIDKSALPMQIFRRHANMVAGDVIGDDLLFEMQAASVNPNEPIFAGLRTNFMKSNAEKMRLKGQYPLRDCLNLRMIPDHLELLEEGEVFIAIGQGKDVRHAKQAILMRNPSYFSGDLRKLNVIPYEILHERSLRECSLGSSQNQCIEFFRSLLSSTGGAVVLSTKGDRSEAHRMSGGDFDGDKAWVCWFEKLVDPIVSLPAEDFDAFETVPVNASDIPHHSSSTATINDRIQYSWHFRRHQSHLGSLANTLDKVIDRFGFKDSAEAAEVGMQAFLQVDDPYDLCEIKACVNDQVKKLNDPHWKGKTNFSPSSKQYFVGKLYDFVGAAINKAVEAGSVQVRIPDQRIERFIKKSFTLDNLETLSLLRGKMKKVANNYDKELAKTLERAKLHDGDADAFIKTWKSCFIQQLKRDIFQGLDDTESMVHAAVLYEQTFQLAQDKAAGRATVAKQRSKIDSADLAWRVASDKLCTVIARASPGLWPLVVTKDSERLMFGKKIKKNR